MADQVLVADCFSTDETLAIAQAHGARVVQRAWVSHATQFNWALTQLERDTDWVLRLDADEYLTPELAAEIRARLPGLAPEVDGVYCGRRMTFQGRLIRFGGVFPIRVLRHFRYGRGQCENRWMDEHIKVPGPTANLRGEIIDDNLNSLTWWTEKHNRYASREAVDLLNLEYGFMPGSGRGAHYPRILRRSSSTIQSVPTGDCSVNTGNSLLTTSSTRGLSCRTRRNTSIPVDSAGGYSWIFAKSRSSVIRTRPSDWQTANTPGSASPLKASSKTLTASWPDPRRSPATSWGRFSSTLNFMQRCAVPGQSRSPGRARRRRQSPP